MFPCVQMMFLPSMMVMSQLPMVLVFNLIIERSSLTCPPPNSRQDWSSSVVRVITLGVLIVNLRDLLFQFLPQDSPENRTPLGQMLR